MKSPIKTIAAVLAALILGAFVTTSTVIHAQQGQSLQAPVAVIVNPAPKHYKVIDIGRFAVNNGQTPAGTLESILNEMGAQGWTVVATPGTFVILMQ